MERQKVTTRSSVNRKEKRKLYLICTYKQITRRNGLICMAFPFTQECGLQGANCATNMAICKFLSFLSYRPKIAPICTFHLASCAPNEGNACSSCQQKGKTAHRKWLQAYTLNYYLQRISFQVLHIHMRLDIDFSPLDLLSNAHLIFLVYIFFSDYRIRSHVVLQFEPQNPL